MEQDQTGPVTFASLIGLPAGDDAGLTKAMAAANAVAMLEPLKLFVKPGCPWCTIAEEWLEHRGYQYERIDVISDRRAYDEMQHLSGQRRAPTLQVGDLVLPDFGPDELAVFLKQHSITP